MKWLNTQNHTAISIVVWLIMTHFSFGQETISAGSTEKIFSRTIASGLDLSLVAGLKDNPINNLFGIING